MSEFQSLLANDMEAYKAYRKASGHWNCTYDKYLRLFDRYCFQRYPTDKALNQDMVDGWCAQRPAETNNSCIARISGVLRFVEYLRMRGKTDVIEPDLPKRERCTYMPHAFTVRELKNFFDACDNLPSTPHTPPVLARKITIPVFFRLLYSSGIRTCEARMLRPEDVDLDQGILNILHSKGEAQHFVALHDTMLDLMRKYNAAIHSIYPGRQYFFPSPIHSSYYRQLWVSSNFRELWSMVNVSSAIAYDLRHNYAIQNINQWVGHGFDFDAKLLYLSKSMGHSTLESTRYYYSIVPAMSDIIEDLSGEDFDDIVPEVDYEES